MRTRVWSSRPSTTLIPSSRSIDFELMSASGTRQFDTNEIIQRYEQRILMSVLADFILVGHEQAGSYSLHTDKTGIFRAALNAITKSIADTLNRHLVPRLFEINGWELEKLPKFEPSNIDPPDLTSWLSSSPLRLVPGCSGSRTRSWRSSCATSPAAGDDRGDRGVQASAA